MSYGRNVYLYINLALLIWVHTGIYNCSRLVRHVFCNLALHEYSPPSPIHVCHEWETNEQDSVWELSETVHITIPPQKVKLYCKCMKTDLWLAHVINTWEETACPQMSHSTMSLRSLFSQNISEQPPWQNRNESQIPPQKTFASGETSKPMHIMHTVCKGLINWQYIGPVETVQWNGGACETWHVGTALSINVCS